jgi:hypothetical protein
MLHAGWVVATNASKIASVLPAQKRAFVFAIIEGRRFMQTPAEPELALAVSR